MKDKLETQFWE